MPSRALSLALTLLCSAPALALAQNGALKRAAETITEADVARRIGVIAHDSMGGRATGSPGLLKTARWVAGEFRRFGLKPGGDSGTFLQTYHISRKRVLAERSTVTFSQTDGGAGMNATLAEGAAWIGGATRTTARGPLVLMGGALDPAGIKAADVAGRVVVLILPADNTSPRSYRAMLGGLASAGAVAVAAVTPSDSLFARMKAGGPPIVTVVGDGPGMAAIGVLERTVTTQVPEAGATFAQIRQAPTMVVAPYPDWEGVLSIQDTTISTLASQNTVGILEGSDPALRGEYLVFSAHMDHVGTTGRPMAACRAQGADSICNGADDDASGTVGVVELAEALSRPDARPRRSMIFLTVSGEEQGLWGSAWFADHPGVPLDRIVANINLDMIGRNWTDTIAVIGKEHSDLGATLNRVNAAHPELRMTAVDDLWPQERFYFRSDHFNFARKGVPILFFFNGVHPDYHRVSDSPEKIDAEKEARILRLIYYLGQEVANAAERPKWVPESYRQIVQP
ncbi:MAG TPA: M20/M25/M40 family metallo-hydrolase [Gemmatimonadales bacterium]|nr:M20/M25/M40 family metallo-hydrolase [Gemmatimonadales bacterium]